MILNNLFPLLEVVDKYNSFEGSTCILFEKSAVSEY